MSALNVTLVHSPDMPLGVRLLSVDQIGRRAETEIKNQRDSGVIYYSFKFEESDETGDLGRTFHGCGPVDVEFLSSPSEPYPDDYIPPRETRRVQLSFPQELSLLELLSRLFKGPAEPSGSIGVECGRLGLFKRRKPRTVSVSLDLVIFEDGMAWGGDEWNQSPSLGLYFRTFPARAGELLKEIGRTGFQEQVKWAEAVTGRWRGQRWKAVHGELSSEHPARRQAAMDQQADYFLAFRVLAAEKRGELERLIPRLQRISQYKLELWRP